MPHIRQEGKHTIIFRTKEEDEIPSKIELPDPEPNPGLIMPNGEINWSCPCLGGMATGPCGLEFRDAFSCFHYSTEEPKGANCYDAFKKMQACMVQYPALYEKKDLDDLKDEDEIKHKKVDLESESKNDLKSDEKVSKVMNEHDKNLTGSGKEITST